MKHGIAAVLWGSVCALFSVGLLPTMALASDAEPAPEEPSPRAGIADSAPAEEEEEPTVELSLTSEVWSRYLWKGTPWTESGLSVTSLDVSAYGCTLGAILYQPFFGTDGAPTPYETDVYASCDIDLGSGFTVTPAAEYWVYPSTADDGWPVLYFGATASYAYETFSVWSTHGVMALSAAEAYYGEVGAGWADQVGPVSLEVSSQFGWGNEAFMASMFGVNQAAPNQVELNVDAGWEMTPGVELVGGGTVAALLDPALDAALGGTFFYSGRLGVRLSTGF